MKTLTGRQKIVDTALGLIIPVSLVLILEFATSREIISPVLIKPPRETALTFVDLVSSGELWENLRVSLLRVFAGFVAGSSLGFVVGSFMGSSRRIEQYVAPLFHGVRQVAILAWIPLLIIMFGIGEGFRVVFIALSAFFPVALNTFEGVRGVPAEYLEVAKVFEYGKIRTLRKVIIPAAVPTVFVGLRLALSMSWMAVIGAELIASSSGLGYMMTTGRTLFQQDVVMVGIVTIGSFGLLTDSVMKAVQTRLLGWRLTI